MRPFLKSGETPESLIEQFGGNDGSASMGNTRSRQSWPTLPEARTKSKVEYRRTHSDLGVQFPSLRHSRDSRPSLGSFNEDAETGDDEGYEEGTSVFLDSGSSNECAGATAAFYIPPSNEPSPSTSEKMVTSLREQMKKSQQQQQQQPTTTTKRKSKEVYETLLLYIFPPGSVPQYGID